MKLLFIGETAAALPQIDESYFIEVMEHRSRVLMKLLATPGKVITAPLHIDAPSS